MMTTMSWDNRHQYIFFGVKTCQFFNNNFSFFVTKDWQVFQKISEFTLERKEEIPI